VSSSISVKPERLRIGEFIVGVGERNKW
jgi:hypothetical protein